mgnify:CR=1 FL=1
MKRKDWALIVQMVALVSQLGITMISAVGVAFFIGRLLDRWLGFNLIFTIIFLVLGVGGGFLAVYQLVRRYIRDKEDDLK